MILTNLETGGLHIPFFYVKCKTFFIPGAGDGTRTRNLLITNQLLCQLSYASMQRLQTYMLRPDKAIFF